MDRKIEEHISATGKNLEAIRESLHEIRDAQQKENVIIVKNGGGREIGYEKKDFFQMIYDRNKAVAMSFVKEAILFGTLITMILKLFNII